MFCFFFCGILFWKKKKKKNSTEKIVKGKIKVEVNNFKRMDIWTVSDLL